MAKNAGVLCFPATESQAIRAQRQVFCLNHSTEHYRLAKKVDTSHQKAKGGVK